MFYSIDKILHMVVGTLVAQSTGRISPELKNEIIVNKLSYISPGLSNAFNIIQFFPLLSSQCLGVVHTVGRRSDDWSNFWIFYLHLNGRGFGAYEACPKT